MNSIQAIPVVMSRDLKLLFTDKFLLFIMFTNFSIDLFVSGLTLAKMIVAVRGFEYFLYIAPGVNMVTATVAAFQSGRDLWRERILRDLNMYLLSLPVTRVTFVLSRILGGVVRSLLATLASTLVILWLYKADLPGILYGYLTVALYSFAVVGFSVAASVVANTLEGFATLRSTIQVYLSFLSTQFYPADVLPPLLQGLVLLNPLTWAVESFRGIQAGAYSLAFTGLLVVTAGFIAFLGSILYYRKLSL